MIKANQDLGPRKASAIIVNYIIYKISPAWGKSF